MDATDATGIGKAADCTTDGELLACGRLITIDAPRKLRTRHALLTEQGKDATLQCSRSTAHKCIEPTVGETFDTLSILLSFPLPLALDRVIIVACLSAGTRTG